MILELCFSPHRLGKTDLLVSTVGFGGCVVGGEYPDKGDLQEIIKVIEKLLLDKIFTFFLVCGGRN